MKRLLLKSLILTGMFLIPAGAVFASGFALVEQSVSGQGSSFSGGAAAAEDASTIYLNPAGMLLIRGQQVIAGTQLIMPKAKMHISEATSPAIVINPAFASISGDNDVEGGESGVVPNLYYVNNPGNGWAFGLGVNVPFGLSTDYSRTWRGRYHAVESNIQTLNINPSIAYQVNKQLSLGAGISAQYIDVTLSSMVNGGLAAFSATSGVIGTPNSTSDDIFVENKADDWSYGYNLGVLYQFSKTTRVGLAYRSTVTQNLTGKVRTTVPNSVAAIAAGFSNQNIHGSIDLPASASASVYHEFNNKLALQGDVSWTEWSSFDKLTLNFDGSGLGGQMSTTTVENWKDSWRFALGATYQYSDALKLRCGTAFDQTPIPDAAHRTPRIPGEDRTWVNFGAGYKFSERISADIAYAHLFVLDSHVNSALADNPSAGSLVGSSENQVDIASVQLVVNF